MNFEYQIREAFPNIPSQTPYKVAGSNIVGSWEKIRILPGTYPSRLQQISYEGFTFPGSCYVELTFHKNTLETKLHGGAYTLWEKLSAGYWDIQITGMLVSGCLDPEEPINDLLYPHKELKALQNIVNVDGPLSIMGDVFGTLGIQHVIIHKDLKIPKMEQYPYMQAFSIDCVSEEPAELVLKQENGELSLSPQELSIL